MIQHIYNKSGALKQDRATATRTKGSHSMGWVRPQATLDMPDVQDSFKRWDFIKCC